ncbi:hypothetical protein PMAYCL1PPCAC_32865 [Pristionchus mayeri]|uniref:Dehydrogenase n=1 Tax=Pristionchus mayeri TaxID=1317129 RepID=A0AAN5IFR5_9BILA|nr:hypothetical protein PMAYCL1PPCAC_32865 [Pristionchus mayeri]
MRSVLITGANREIGLGLVREFLKEPSVDIVIATVRDVATKEINSITSSKLHVIICNEGDEKSITTAFEKVNEILDGSGLDIVVNNGGLGLPLNGEAPQENVDVIVPVLLAKHLSAQLNAAESKKGSAQIVNIFSSISQLSKEDMRMINKKLSAIWQKDNSYMPRTTCFCPGWVTTDSGTEAADLTVEEYIAPLAQLILSLNGEHNGNLFSFTGEHITCWRGEFLVQ